MLAVKAHDVSFELVGGGAARAARSHGLIHDEAGEVWPRCSLLVGPYTRGTAEGTMDAAARRYYGAGWRARRGRITLPPRALAGQWRKVGTVSRIYYVRLGNVFGGTTFRHKFAARRLWIFPTPAILYRHGRWLRLELPAGCIVNWRGFVSP